MQLKPLTQAMFNSFWKPDFVKDVTSGGQI
jgi:hypothetical protein